MDVQTDQAALSAHDTRRRVFAIVGASSGNLVEWFDFYIYSFCALYFAPAFFPSGNTTTQLLNTAGVFAAGFLMRPIGGWLFGRIADRHGRRNAMMISVLMMCGGSLVIAVLPTYAQIGALAPALLLVARLFQGLSVGGEYGTSATYMSEVALKGRRGFFASFQYVTLIGGQLCALLVLVILQQTLSADELKAWGWRIPFVVGAAAALISLYLRKSLDETSTTASRDKKDAGTIRGVWQHKGAFFTVVGFTAGGSLIFYTFTTYMQKYLVNTAGMHAKTASNVMTVALLVYMLMQPVFGALSDRIGRRTSMILFGSFAVIGTVPLMHALKDVTSPVAAFVLITVALAIVSFYTSISGLIKAEMFPPEVRAMGVGLSYAVANAIFGGSAEYVALWFKSVGSEETFYWYVTVLCAISLIVSWRMRDPSKEGYLRHEP
ncbi:MULTISPECIES: MFS family transporter [Burkholderia]|uniref:Alpha-ketoglutarate permease n=2 Tax=Burkholderia lata (strain ATCC 17760 / DSM 23089 / LMG 22485 / NCIMB 9086 / R18194 / 383) TaxID=482957 RepID=Q39GR7_BURL3|nr:MULTISPECIES: MFS family transporter [Burkholderia]ABB08349.1 Citrate-proton symporter, (MFS_1) [Burkholderia lata]MBN3782590.1 MFS transporter [Burkholderia sp. Ac-20345]VWB25635.1 alpha-ketoglutarate transporter [Burkholderia lata]VWB64668.1 alpha-ketoglutarate transporter [Burkholderia lata]VWB74781.1 alpha-ketoglutarate transporter [Burkholderia lata]